MRRVLLSSAEQNKLNLLNELSLDIILIRVVSYEIAVERSFIDGLLTVSEL